MSITFSHKISIAETETIEVIRHMTKFKAKSMLLHSESRKKAKQRSLLDLVVGMWELCIYEAGKLVNIVKNMESYDIEFFVGHGQ